MSTDDKPLQQTKRTTISYAMDWGKSPLPPILLATLITALHARPFRPLPMLFPPVLVFSTYLNLNSFVVDSAGITAAWSGLYLIMANRRTVKGSFGQRIGGRFGARGVVRGGAMALAAGNLVACGLTYGLGRRAKDDGVAVEKEV
ncbi:hypothetical protein LCER1_G000346 [Lachnellula cervina]|uniref:Uncharacterized protein n=1 Tax=Lachnellula cervina TaxID=1316786 RepID=A0A7D8YY57_9HELO|nr:hypothetical protein LCER1_G000346 [Lachnellula cervina]